MAKIKSLTVEMKGDASGVTRAARTARTAIRGIGRSAKRAVTGIAGIGGALAGIAAGAGVAKLAADAAASIDNFGKLASQLDTTAGEIQKIKVAAELSGVGFDSAIKGVQRLRRSLGDAAQGNKTAIRAFEALGLQWQKMTKLAPTELLGVIGKRLLSLKDPALQASLAGTLLGRTWEKIIPLFKDYAGIMATATKNVDENGFSLTGLTGATENLNDQMFLLTNTATLLRDNVFARLAPAFGELVERVNELVSVWIKANGGGAALSQTIAGNIVSGIRSAIEWFKELGDVIDVILEGFGTLVKGLRFLGQLGGALGAAAVQAGQGNFSGAGAILSEDLGDLFNAANPDDEEQKDNNRRQTDLLSQVVEELRTLQLGGQFQ